MERVARFGSMTFSSLGLYNYRLYFIGQTLSMVGTWMQQIAQTILLLQLHGSGTSLGFLIAAQFLPILVFGSFGGVIADKFPKRKIFFFTQIAAGMLALTQWFVVYTGFIEVWMLFVFALGLGFINAIDNPTKHSFIYDIVGKEHIKNAVSLNASLTNLARIFGPSLAAFIIPVFGIAACFLFNAVSFVAVLIAIFMMRPTELYTPKETKRIHGSVMDGLRYVRSNKTLLYILIMIAITGTLTYEFNVSLALFAAFTFHNTVNGLAMLYTALSIGAVFGGLFSASRKKTSLAAIAKASIIFGTCFVVSSFAPSLTIATLLMIPVGFFSIVFISLANSLLQMTSSEEMRGRVMSLWSMALLGSTPIGGPIIGWIGETFGPRFGIVTGGAAAILAGILIMYHLKKKR